MQKIKANQIKFYGEVITLTRVKNNVLRALLESQKMDVNGLSWYDEANKFAQKIMNDYNNTAKRKLTLGQISAVIAVLSPLKRWEQNKEIAVRFFNNLTYGIDNVENLGYFKGSIKKAIKIVKLELPYHILILDILNGEKIKAFYDNILNPTKSNLVTIDRHALSIALGFKLSNDQYKTHTPTKKQNAFFQSAYLLASRQVGLSGLEVQAQTWEALRIDNKLTLTKSINILKLS